MTGIKDVLLYFTNTYDYQRSFYTGIETQSDTIFLCVKQNGSLHATDLTAFYSRLDQTPFISTFTAIPRIILAVQEIFYQCTQEYHSEECWNAFKNLFRGLLGLIPLLGNITLFLYDSINHAYFFHGDNGIIAKKLKNQDNVAALFSDDRLIFTVPLDSLKEKGAITDPHLMLKRFQLIFTGSCATVEEKCPDMDLPSFLQVFPTFLKGIENDDLSKFL